MQEYKQLLKNKNFVLYSIGQAFSQFGDRLVQIVLIGYVYKRWPGSTFQLAKLFSVTVLPSFIISPIAGVFVDRWDRKKVMVISDLMRAILVLLVPIFILKMDNIIPLYAALFFIFSAACFFLPARFAMIPTLVAKEEILAANSASSIIWVLSGIAGFSLGGIIAEWIGLKVSLYANAAVYGLSATSFLVLFYSIKAKNPPPKPIEKDTFLKDLLVGLKMLVVDRNARLVAGLFFTLASLVGLIYVVGVVFVQETLKSMTKYVGFFGFFLFIGILAGSYGYGRMGRSISRIKSVAMSLALMGCSILAFSFGLRFTGFIAPSAAAMFFLGFFISPVYIAANTVIHESIEQRFGGRIFSSLGIVMNTGFLIFMLISSRLAENIDKLVILAFCGFAFIAVGIGSLFISSSSSS